MDRAEPFGAYSVRDRARAYGKKVQHDVPLQDEMADAVPLGRSHGVKNSSYPPPQRQSAGTNPYRVRDRMARDSARRAAADAHRMQKAPPTRHAPPHRMTQNKTASRAHERTDSGPDMRRNTDRIFHTERDRAQDAGRIEAYRRAVRKKRWQHAKRTVAALLIICLFAAGAFGVIYKLFYIISDMTVEGTSLYSAEEILRASGVAPGDNLYSFSSRIAEENITLHCPYIRSLAVNRTVPDTVHFTLEEDTAAFYAEIYGEMRALSPTLRVLDPITSAEAAAKSLIRVRLPAIERAVAGRVLAFENERASRSIREVLTAVLASDIRTRITAVDLRETNSLKMVCDSKYLLNFGDRQDVDVKLKIAGAVLADSLFSSDIRASVDLTSTGETSVILDDQINLEQ